MFSWFREHLHTPACPLVIYGGRLWPNQLLGEIGETKYSWRRPLTSAIFHHGHGTSVSHSILRYRRAAQSSSAASPRALDACFADFSPKSVRDHTDEHGGGGARLTSAERRR